MSKRKDIPQQDIDTQEYNKNIRKIDYNLSRIPSWLKILVLKYWAAGAAIFFMGMGGATLGIDYSKIDLNDVNQSFGILLQFYIVMCLGLALIMNYICKPLIRNFRTATDDTYKYNLINFRGFFAFVANLLYAAFVMICVLFLSIFFGSRNLLPSLFGSGVAWGLDPFIMGLFYIVIDVICVLIKNVCIRIYKVIKFKRLNKIYNE